MVFVTVPYSLVTSGSFLKFHFPRTWPVLPVHLRFNLKTSLSYPILPFYLELKTSYIRSKSDRICKGLSLFLSVLLLVYNAQESLSGACSQFDQMRLKRYIYERQPFPQYALNSLPHGGLCSRHLSVR